MSNLELPESATMDCSISAAEPSITTGNIVIKVPVVLAETTIQIDMDATITIPDPVLEIKDVKKRVKVVQCRLLLPTNKLFIKGFVRKNIQYATPRGTQSENTRVHSDLRSLTIDVPFQCVTDLTGLYLTPPILPQFNKRKEFEFFTSTPLPTGFPAKENLLGSDLGQFDQQSNEFFNELPFCELISSKITEYDEALNRVFRQDLPFEEGVFTQIEEKMVVELTLKVLQLQQLRVCSTEDGGGYCP